MGFDARTARLDRAVSAMTAATSSLLREVAVIDRDDLWKADGATSMSGWLAGRYGVAWATAREWVRVARALEGLPRIAGAFRAGRLSWDQLRPLTRFAEPDTDKLWASRGPGMRPAALWLEARRHERARLREAQEHHRRRYLSLRWDPEHPVLWLEGMLPSDQGAALETALNARAERLPADPEAVDPGGARLADALVGTASGGEPATVVVHAQAEVLAASEGIPRLAETQDGVPLPSETVRRLACDGRIEWILESRGRPVGIGRRGRQVPGALGRALRFRDRGCRFPGCERKRWLHAHHLHHWARGGPTDLDNLVLLCGFHQPPPARGRMADHRAPGPGPPVPRPGRPAPAAAPGLDGAAGGRAGEDPVTSVETADDPAGQEEPARARSSRA
jgi:Domain of unknown function (DUF222)/HNH endonuclease